MLCIDLASGFVFFTFKPPPHTPWRTKWPKALHFAGSLSLTTAPLVKPVIARKRRGLWNVHGLTLMMRNLTARTAAILQIAGRLWHPLISLVNAMHYIIWTIRLLIAYSVWEMYCSRWAFFFYQAMRKLTGIKNPNQIHQEIFECSQFMKDLLQDHLRTNGSTSDANPLLFTLATPQESRALLWALYAKYVYRPMRSL